MATRTLAQLRTSVRQRADMESSQFVTDAEINDMINASAGEWHDLIVNTFEDYYTTFVTFTMTRATNVYALPADFLKIRRLQMQDPTAAIGAYRKVPLFNMEDMERASGALRRQYGCGPYRAYRIIQNGIWFLPEDDASGTYRMFYVQSFVPMLSDSDALPDWQGWSEYVVIDAAVKCLQKEESDCSLLMAQKAAIKQRIETAADDRDVGEPEHVSNVVQSRTDIDGWDW